MTPTNPTIDTIQYVIERLNETAQAVLPTVLQIEQMSGVATVFGGVCSAVLCGGCVYATSISIKKFRVSQTPANYDMGNGLWIGAGVAGASGIVVFGIGALIQLLDLWTWVSIFNPKLALAHDILLKALSH